MILDQKIWGPHYWFFLHTIAMSYPLYPNTITKKKYYDFIQNIPLFLPIESFSKDFSALLDEYPVIPYLDSRDALIRWMHFIHNKINIRLEKPTLSLHEFYKSYYDSYKPRETKHAEFYNIIQKIIYIIVIGCIVFACYHLYSL